MTSADDGGRTILRNMLLGRWAAEKLGLTGAAADTYASGLAREESGPLGNDVFTKVRRDFDAAGVSATDEQILAVMSELLLKAGRQLQDGRTGSADGAAVALARNLMSRG